MSTTQTMPTLQSGMKLNSEEFLRRWEALPNLEDLELINGIVHMPQHVTAIHGDTHNMFIVWLGLYKLNVPAIKSYYRTSWLMNEWNMPQPDISYIILPEYGDQSKNKGDIAVGSPEFILEVSDTGAEVELSEKLNYMKPQKCKSTSSLKLKLRESTGFVSMKVRISH